MYGLGSSIWTKDLAKARQAVEQIQAGYTWVTDIQVAYDQLPFGGSNHSGFGEEPDLPDPTGCVGTNPVFPQAG